MFERNKDVQCYVINDGRVKVELEIMKVSQSDFRYLRTRRVTGKYEDFKGFMKKLTYDLLSGKGR